MSSKMPMSERIDQARRIREELDRDQAQQALDARIMVISINAGCAAIGAETDIEIVRIIRAAQAAVWAAKGGAT